MESAIISVILIWIIMPLLLKSKEKVGEGNDKITFEFNKNFKMVMLACVVMSIVITVIAFISALHSKEKEEIFLAAFFALLSLGVVFLYLFTKNKRIVCEINVLRVYNAFGRQKVFYIKDITVAIERPSDGMKLIFKDNSKIKIDAQMTNYSKIKEILDKNKIVYKDKHGNNNPKGW